MDEKYNKEVTLLADNKYALNKYVMIHTVEMCKTNPTLIDAIKNTKEKQFVLYEDEELDQVCDGPTTNIIVSKKRSLEAAKAYKGKKVAVLNFANNHSVGGAPYSSNAQEESLCRESTLYECLKKEQESFYKKHQIDFDEGKLDYWGNGDLIYSPDVTVFKEDSGRPVLLKEEDWFKVDIITLAAPECNRFHGGNADDYVEKVLPRVKQLFSVAKQQGVEVLILGAWGCGAFRNPPKHIAEVFKYCSLLYHFDTIEFAIYCKDWETSNYETFKKVFDK